MVLTGGKSRNFVNKFGFSFAFLESRRALFVRVLMLVGDKTRFFVLPASARWNEPISHVDQHLNLHAGEEAEEEVIRRVIRFTNDSKPPRFPRSPACRTSLALATLLDFSTFRSNPRFRA